MKTYKEFKKQSIRYTVILLVVSSAIAAFSIWMLSVHVLYVIPTALGVIIAGIAVLGLTQGSGHKHYLEYLELCEKERDIKKKAHAKYQSHDKRSTSR